MWQSVTFTAASANLDNFTAIDTGPGDATHKDGSPQGIRVFAQTTNAADEHVLSLVLVRGNAVYAHFTATVAGTARRTGSANDAGLYVCDVEFSETTNSKFDLMGDWYENRQKNRGLGGAEAGAVWMIGCTTFDGDATALNVQIAPSSVA
jgi:hypothetical protein